MIDNQTCSLRAMIGRAVALGYERRLASDQAVSARAIERATLNDEYVARRVDAVLSALPEAIASAIANCTQQPARCHVMALHACEVIGLPTYYPYRYVPVIVRPANLSLAAAVIFRRLTVAGYRPQIFNSFPAVGDWRSFETTPHSYLSLQLVLS